MLNSRRSEVLRRAEDAARVTIPALFVREGHTESSNLPTPYQGLGARAVNTLAAKLILALFPPDRFFRLKLSAAVRRGLSEESLKNSEETLSDIESETVDAFEASNARSILPDMMRQLLVAGNYLVDVDPNGDITGYRLSDFVVDRDVRGTLVEGVIRETVSPQTLEPEVVAACDVKPDSNNPDDGVTVYTWFRMKPGGKTYEFFQEINGHRVPNSEGTFPADRPRFIALRWTAVGGENYGRGMVSEYQGDFNALDDLSRDILKASANAAKIIWLRDPNGTVSARKLASAKSGDVLDGRRDEINALTMEKYADFRVTLERINSIEESLKSAFLMHSSVQRQADRVTAEEVRFMANELETALGGVYSVLARELQVPYLGRFIDVMSRRKVIPKLPKEMVRLTIITGMDALGRGQDLNMIRSAIGVAREVLGEEEVTVRINTDSVLTRIATAHGLKKSEFLNTEEQVAAIRQQRMASQVIQGAAPGVATEVTKGMMQQ
jgi:hypothetical protein